MRHFVVCGILGLFVGCGTSPLDPTMNCHREYTSFGVDFRVCAVNSGNSFIETDYGDLDCASWNGRQNCQRTAELYLGDVDTCMRDAADQIAGISDL